MLRSICVFSGNANVPLADAICRFMEIPRGQVKISRFADGEIFAEIGENVRGVDAYVIQPMAKPVNDHLMELLILVDSLKRASAGQITAVIPYYGYGRQDRKVAPRTPITAKLVADLLTASGVDRVLAMDLHAGQIQGFFNIPFDHLFAMPVFLEHLKNSVGKDPVIVSPDAGGVERARAYAKRLGGSIAIIDKRRERANVSEVMHIVGEVEGRETIVLDDMIDTAGTICNAAVALQQRGAKRILACATHGVLSGNAAERLAAAPFEEVVLSDTLPIPPEARALPKVKVLSVARILGEAIKRIHHSDSVSSLFV